MNTPTPPAGWYPDPDASQQQQRYWDGNDWTDHTAPVGAAPTPTASAPAPRTSPTSSRAGRIARRGLILVLIGVLLMVGAAMIGGATDEALLDDAFPFARIAVIVGAITLLVAGIVRLTESGQDHP